MTSNPLFTGNMPGLCSGDATTKLQVFCAFQLLKASLSRIESGPDFRQIQGSIVTVV